MLEKFRVIPEAGVARASQAVRAFRITVADGSGGDEQRQVWEAVVSAPNEGVYSLRVSVEDLRGKTAIDEIRSVSGDLANRKRAERDQDSAVEAWPEHGLLGTQLGPNKNGKKW